MSKRFTAVLVPSAFCLPALAYAKPRKTTAPKAESVTPPVRR